MALRIIYPAAYQPMDFSPRSLFEDMGCSLHPMMRKRRRVVSADFIDKVFNDMFSVPSYEACTKKKAESSSDGLDTSFSKKMFLRNYKPENIQVRVTTDKKVIVEGKQELKEEDKDGFQSYQLKEFKQTVNVPENVNIDELTSSFSDEGVLTITAPLLALTEPEKKEETKLEVTFDKKEGSEKNSDESMKNDGDTSASSQKKSD